MLDREFETQVKKKRTVLSQLQESSRTRSPGRQLANGCGCRLHGLFGYTAVHVSSTTTMTAVTRNLPLFMQELGVSVIGQVSNKRMLK